MNKGILILAMLVALLACRPLVSVAEGKDKPCLVIGQVKDYLTHVLIEGAKVTLLGATDKPCGVRTVANPKQLLNGT